MAAGNVKGIIIEIEGNTKGLSKSLSDVNKTLKSTQDSLKIVNKALKLDPKNVETLQTKQNLLNTAIEETRQKLDIEREAAEKAAKALEEGTITQNQYDALQAEVAATAAELNKLEDEAKNTQSALDGVNAGGFKNVSKDIQAAGEAITEFGNKVTKVGDGMQKLGGNLTKSVTAPILGFGKASLDSFNEVDGAMDTVIKKTGATGAQAEALNNVMKNLATSSELAGTTFEDASVAVGEVNTRFGVTGDELESLSGQFIKFAKINDADLNSSIDTVQKALASFGLETKDAGALMDVLTATSQKTGVSVDTLASGLVSNSAAFQEMGLTAYQASEFMGQVELSGADLNTFLSGFQKALKNSTADGATMNEALAELQNTVLNGKDGVDGLTAAYDLFGKSGANIYEAVKNGTIDFQNLGSSIGILGDSLGTVSTTFTETQDGIDQVTASQNAMKDALAEVGATIGETVAPMLQSLSETIKGVADWWKSLDEGTQQFIIKAAMVAAVIGPVLIILGSLISSIGTIVSTIGLAVTGIGTLTGGAGLAGLGAAITGTILPAIGAAIAAAAPVIAVIAGVVAAITGVILIIKNWGAIVEWLKGIWEGFKSFISGLWNGIKSLASTVWNGIKNTISTVTTGLGNFLSGAWEGIKSTASAAWEGLKSTASAAWEGLKSKVSSTVENLKTSVGEKWESIKSAASSAWDSIKSSISDRASSIKEAAVNAFNGARDGIKNVISNAAEWGRDMMSNLKSGIEAGKNWVVGAAKSVAGSIKSFLGFSEPENPPLNDFHTYGPDMMDLYAQGIRQNTPKVEAAAAGAAQAVRQSITGGTDYTTQLGTINRSIQGIQTGGGDIAVYVQISDGQLERALANITRGQKLRSGGR